MYLTGDVFRSNTSLTRTLNNYAVLNNPVFLAPAIYFLTTGNNGRNISYSSSSFGISLNNVIIAISINNTGVVSIPAEISKYSATSQPSKLISNSLSNCVTSSNLTSTLSNYVTSSNLTSTLSKYNTTSQTNALISNILTNYSATSHSNSLVTSPIVTNQSIMTIIF